MLKETATRSITKTITWRFVGSSTVAIASYIMTGDITVALATVSSTFLANAGLYFVHERVWSLVKWGYEDETKS